MHSLTWYFDYVSPFAYFQLKSLETLGNDIKIMPAPVVFGAILKQLDHKGPAEIPGKREHTYRFCQWYADTHQIAFKMPPAHPFNSLELLRYTISRNSDLQVIESLFDAVFAEGLLPGDADYWPWVSQKLGEDMVQPIEFDSNVKQQLQANTTEAIERGVFGVPTLHFEGRNYWGVDAMPMLRHAMANPGCFDTAEFERLANLPSAVVRK